jgi:hypothetical protein
MLRGARKYYNTEYNRIIWVILNKGTLENWVVDSKLG